MRSKVGPASGPWSVSGAAALGEREDRRSLAAAGPARSDPDAARIVDGRVARLGGHPAGVELDSRAEASGSTSAASGATVALASVRSVAGDTGKTAVGGPGRRPDHRVAAQVGIHHDPDRLAVADRRDAADGEPGELVRLARRGPSDVLLAGHGRQPGQVDPVGTRHEAQDRIEPVGVIRGDEHERLDDLADVRTDRGGGLGGGMGGLVEDPDIEGHALPCGSLPDALDPGMFGGVGHGGSLPSGGRVASPGWRRSCSTGTARWPTRSGRSTPRTSRS